MAISVTNLGHAVDAVGTGTSVSLTLSTNVPAGSLIVVYVTEYTDSTAGAITDSAGNNYNPGGGFHNVTMYPNGAVANGTMYVTYTYNCLALSSGNTITYTKSGPTTNRASVGAFYATGILSNADPWDAGALYKNIGSGINYEFGNSSTPTIGTGSGGTGHPNSTNCLVVPFLFAFTNGTPTLPGSPWNNPPPDNFVYATDLREAGAYQIDLTQSNLTWSPTFTGAVVWCTTVVGFIGVTVITSTGTANMNIAVNGAGASVVKSAGTASMNIAVNGTGAALKSAAGTANMQIVVNGKGTAVTSAAGTATMQIGVLGNSPAPSPAVGTANMQIAVSGFPGTPRSAAGTVSMSIGIAGSGVGVPGPIIPPPMTTVQNTLLAYLYVQYNDDNNLQAFIAAYNTITQQYVDSFNSLNLPYYPALTGTLLDWIGAGLYGYSRPTLPNGTTAVYGPYNTWVYNSIVYGNYLSISPPGTSVTTDDTYQRCLTWHLFKGDGKVFNVTWLKRRIERFLKGANGITNGMIGSTYDVSVTFPSDNDVTIKIPTSAEATIFKNAVDGGALELPFQFDFTVTLV